MVSLLGVTLAAVAACCLAAQALTVRFVTYNGRTEDVMFVVLLVNLAVIVPLALVLVPDPTLTATAFVAFVAAAAVSTVLGRACYFVGIRRVGASRAEPIKASMPLWATVLAVVLLDERMTGLQFIGILVSSAAARSSLGRGPRPTDRRGTQFRGSDWGSRSRERFCSPLSLSSCRSVSTRGPRCCSGSR